jgi:hypothetical protein
MQRRDYERLERLLAGAQESPLFFIREESYPLIVFPGQTHLSYRIGLRSSLFDGHVKKISQEREFTVDGDLASSILLALSSVSLKVKWCDV